MEQVLDIYSLPYDAQHPVLCMDETPRQLIRETRQPIAAAPGRPQRHDYEYERCGVCNVFMASEPLAGRRLTKVTERRTKADWALFVQDIAASYPEAARITLVMDNLNAHTTLDCRCGRDRTQRIEHRIKFGFRKFVAQADRNHSGAAGRHADRFTQGAVATGILDFGPTVAVGAYQAF